MLKDKTYNLVVDSADPAIKQEVDGYLYFVDVNGKHYGAHALRMVADYLDDLNKEWNQQVIKAFKDVAK